MTPTEPANGVHALRLTLTLTGALAGLAFWALVDPLADRAADDRLILGLSVLVVGFFAPVLVATGPLAFRRAIWVGALIGPPVAILAFWASFRYALIGEFLENGTLFAALTILIGIPVPFLIAAFTRSGGWRDYLLLFDSAWEAAVRIAAALAFMGIFWAVIGLSSLLFELVGLEIISDLLDIDAVPFVLTGGAIGLGLAVAAEISGVIGPNLPLRLLRLLLPLLLVVTAVFLLALPFQGLSSLFGNISSAAVLLSIAAAAATLISAAIDRDDDAAVQGPVMRGSVQGLAVVLALLGGLAVFAVWLRVDQYGWSPDRVVAFVAALVALLYGLLYAVAVVLRGHWMHRIRQANIVKAGVLVAVSAAYLTPILNPERISTANQIARLVDGKAEAETLDLWAIGRTWGVAGARGLAALRQRAEDGDGTLAARFALLDRAESQYQFREFAELEAMRDDIRAFGSTVTVLPEGASLPEGFLSVDLTDDTPVYGRPARQVRRWTDACARQTPGGHPGCLVLIEDLLTSTSGSEVILFLRQESGKTTTEAYARINNRWQGLRAQTPEGVPVGVQDGDLIDRVMAGDFSIVPPNLRALRVGPFDLLFVP